MHGGELRVAETPGRGAYRAAWSRRHQRFDAFAEVRDEDQGVARNGRGRHRALGLRGEWPSFGYFDIGNVWGANQQIAVSSLRASIGIGFSWISPVGPLKLSYGRPVRSKPGDRIQNLQFQIGTAF